MDVPVLPTFSAPITVTLQTSSREFLLVELFLNMFILLPLDMSSVCVTLEKSSVKLINNVIVVDWGCWAIDELLNRKRSVTLALGNEMRSRN